MSRTKVSGVRTCDHVIPLNDSSGAQANIGTFEFLCPNFPFFPFIIHAHSVSFFNTFNLSSYLRLDPSRAFARVSIRFKLYCISHLFFVLLVLFDRLSMDSKLGRAPKLLRSRAFQLHTSSITSFFSNE